MIRFKTRWLVSFVLIFFLLFFQLPYYYSGPGSALALNNFITVEDGYEEEGAFMLTTVKMGRATIPFYIWAKVSPYRTLHSMNQLKYDGESDKEYHERQLFIMKESQDAAKIVAYRAANKDVSIAYNGVIVTSVLEEMPANEVLLPGDVIVQVDGEEIETAEQLLARLKGKTVRDTVSITVRRDGSTLTFPIGFSKFPEELGADDDAVGIGIVNPVTERELTFDPDVYIDTSQIGGPSAGLMFSLEIYNQLQPVDITKGYAIAGTGTLDEEGRVGRIGGAGQKVVAAHKAGADYFFAPNEGGAQGSNYAEAVEAAEQIGTAMEIVPVDTFTDALRFLETLQERD